jgi:hypothetical protein
MMVNEIASMNAPKDVNQSVALMQRISATPNACWTNARRAFALTLVGYYVEGWCMRPAASQPTLGFCFEHAWLETATGVVLDPTLPDVPLTYFGGVRYTIEEMCDALVRPHAAGGALIWHGNGWSGLGHPSYRAAYLECQQACGVSAAFLTQLTDLWH